MVKQAACCNGVLDYIPLEQISSIEHEIISKSSDSFPDKNRREHVDDHHPQQKEQKMSRTGSITEAVVKRLEKVTGVDIDGDGVCFEIPHFNPDTHEVQLILKTIEGGHNAGA